MQQNKYLRMMATVKYEKKIEELKTQCQLKTDECHEAWMSLTAASEQLEKVRMELDNKFLQNLYLGKKYPIYLLRLYIILTKEIL